MSSITIPDIVTSIGIYAFYRCAYITIYGYAGSYTETYAKNNGIPFKRLSESSVSNITTDKKEYNIFVGDAATIEATVTPSDASDKR